MCKGKVYKRPREGPCGRKGADGAEASVAPEGGRTQELTHVKLKLLHLGLRELLAPYQGLSPWPSKGQPEEGDWAADGAAHQSPTWPLPWAHTWTKSAASSRVRVRFRVPSQSP